MVKLLLQVMIHQTYRLAGEEPPYPLSRLIHAMLSSWILIGSIFSSLRLLINDLNHIIVLFAVTAEIYSDSAVLCTNIDYNLDDQSSKCESM